ncbi:MAG: antibiotic biosynthesis monooxygenase [Armatimonadetes bacterium]|nr:antibiotic biosynthesis monooxygenase [Armatimonadota bacterium]
MSAPEPPEAIELLALAPRPGCEDVFAEWRHSMLQAARGQAGFEASEVFQPLDGLQDRWVLFLRFDRAQRLREWLDSDVRRALLEQAAELSQSPPQQQVIAGLGSIERPVSVVVETRVPPERLEAFKAWQNEMLEEEKRFPGFLDSRVIEPVPGVSEDWTIVVRFDSSQHLDTWLESDARRSLMARVEPELQGGELRRVVSSFEGWFPLSVEAGTQAPPEWKQALTVLVALYPMVVLLTVYMAPWLGDLGLSFPWRALVSNVLSTVLLTWMVMPPLNTLLKPWLYPHRPSPAVDVAGTGAVLLGLALMVALFCWMG